MINTSTLQVNHKSLSPRFSPGSVTLHVSELGGDLDHIMGNMFRLGRVIVELDPQYVTDVEDEHGNSFRISGPLGPENLRRYKKALEAGAKFAQLPNKPHEVALPENEIQRDVIELN